MTIARAVFATVFVAVVAEGQELGTVRVTSATANVRSEPNDKAPVLTQVKLGTVLTLKAIEGDWFKVQLPPMGSIRVEAYISRKVSAIQKRAPEPLAPAPVESTPVVATGPPVDSQSGMTVLWLSVGASTWVPYKEGAVAQIAERGDSVRAIASVLPPDLHAPIAAGPSQVTYVWTLDAPATGATLGPLIEDRRPAFIVNTKDVKGVSAEGLSPAIVRLSAAPSGRRVVALVRGRADEIARTTPEWDFFRDFRQDAIKSLVQVLEPGSTKVQPVEDLVPGEYAIVIRPPRKRFAGATVLSKAAEGVLFVSAWPFTVR